MPASERSDPTPPDPPAASSETNQRAWRTTLVAVAGLIVIIDQLTKWWAVSTLATRDIELFWTARFNLHFNTGSAFGLNTQFGRWLGVLVLGIVVAITWYSRRVRERHLLVLLGAMVGGAIGNVLDRIFRADDGFMSGGVVDFIDFQWWPIFNVADMAVVMSAIGLALFSQRAPEQA